MLIAIHLNAGNDRNGNPRRIYLVLDEDARVVNALDESYRGRDALDSVYVGCPVSAELEITPREYRALLRGRRRGALPVG